MAAGGSGNGRGDSFAAILYAEPGALGLLTNVMAALLVAIVNMLTTESSPQAVIITGVHLILIGGFLQLVASFLCFRRNEHLTATAFVVFSSLWTIQGVVKIQSLIIPAEVLSRAILPGMIGYCAVAVVLFLAAMTVNYVMPPVLVAMFLTLVFESVGLFYTWGRRVAAAFEIIIVLTGIYAVVVMILKGVTQRYVLPGFGNAPYDTLLIRTKASDKKKNQKKKNTKYAEPMGLGYLGNLIPAVVLAFHHLGYIQDFRPAAILFLSSILCHVMASFYAFLRHDFFHSVEFIIYFVFWITKGARQVMFSYGYFIGDPSFYGQWGMVLISIALLVVSASQNKVVFLYNLLFSIITILSLGHIPPEIYNYTFGVTCALMALATVYVSFAHLVNSIAEKPVVFVGQEVISEEKLKTVFKRIFSCCRSATTESDERRDSDEIDDNVVDTVCFIANTVAAITLSSVDVARSLDALPWLLVAGCFLHLYLARLAFAAGSLAKTYVMLLLAMIWSTWFFILLTSYSGRAVFAISVAVLCLHSVAMVLSLSFKKIWLPFSIMVELNAVVLVMHSIGAAPRFLILVTSLMFGLVSLYGAIANIINGVLEEDIIPLGDPIIKEKACEDDEKASCPTFISRRPTALRKAGEIINNGGVVAVPTDTVYALSASCKHPDSVEKLFKIKGRPSEKPIALCLSNLEQLKGTNPNFSPLLWRFMNKCYPGGISCVVPKGDWLSRLGLDEAVKYIGSHDRLCIRIPDSSVLSYLGNMTGPLAITSANISGEPESTHHDMVVASLGDKIDGVVMDGTSREVVASTVVDCLKIDEGELEFLRIGCISKERIEELLEEAKNEMKTNATTVNIDTMY